MRNDAVLDEIFIFKHAKTLSFLSLFYWPVCCQSQLYKHKNPQWNAAEIKLNLEKLNVLGSVLYFAAHPDDENTRLIAWLAQEKKYRTGYLSLTPW